MDILRFYFFRPATSDAYLTIAVVDDTPGVTQTGWALRPVQIVYKRKGVSKWLLASPSSSFSSSLSWRWVRLRMMREPAVAAKPKFLGISRVALRHESWSKTIILPQCTGHVKESRMNLQTRLLECTLDASSYDSSLATISVVQPLVSATSLLSQSNSNATCHTNFFQVPEHLDVRDPRAGRCYRRLRNRRYVRRRRISWQPTPLPCILG